MSARVTGTYAMALVAESSHRQESVDESNTGDRSGEMGRRSID